MWGLTKLWVTITLVLLSGCNGASSKPGELASPKPSEANSSGNKATSAAQPTVETREIKDYAPIPLDRLIGTAELIVTGEVLTVKDGTFTARIKNTLVGEASPEAEIQQYIPSPFEGAPRPSPYQAGQTFLWFLMTDEKNQRQKAWRIMGAGGEGEMPIEDGFVYFPSRHVEGLTSESHRVQGAQRSIQRFDAEAFFDAVKKYRACFKWQPPKAEKPKPSKICDQPNLDQFSRRSAIHKYLADSTLNRLK